MTSATIDTDTAPAAPARDWERWARERCARSCSWRSCTGKGSTARWSHRCLLRPDVDVDLGDCVCGAPAVVQLFNRRSCARCAPAQPTGGYCAPGRCYCPTAPDCQRPAS